MRLRKLTVREWQYRHSPTLEGFSRLPLIQITKNANFYDLQIFQNLVNLTMLRLPKLFFSLDLVSTKKTKGPIFQGNRSKGEHKWQF